jgi:hypothetical protein
MLAQALQIFLGKEHLVKKMADLHPRQGNLPQMGQVFFTTQNRLEISFFFKHSS